MEELHQRLLNQYYNDKVLDEQRFANLFKEYKDSLPNMIYHGMEGEELFSKYVELTLDKCTNIRNVYIPTMSIPHYRKGHFAEVDSLLIHNTGVYIVEYKNYRGIVSGEASSNEWSLVYANGNKYTIKNQIQQLLYHLDRVQGFLSERGFPDTVPIYACLVYADAADISITGNNTKVNILSQYEFLRRVKLVMKTQPCISDKMCSDIVNVLGEFSDSSIEMKYIHNLILMGNMEQFYNSYFARNKI